MLHWAKDALFVVAAFIAAGVLLPIVQLATPLLVLAVMLAAAVLIMDWAVEHLGRRSWKAMVAEVLVTMLLVGFILLAAVAIVWAPNF